VDPEIELELEQKLLKSTLITRLFGGSPEPVSLGRFELRRWLGSGATGGVYEALDPERGCAVAIKVLSRVDAKSVYRIKKEFRSLAELSHPNVVALDELFHVDDQWFFSMELVDGVPFDEWVSSGSGALRVDRLRHALGQLVQAVNAIHAAGRLHCDLKPSNVLVTAQGRVVVLDFGLVTDQGTGGEARSVNSGLVGTPAYMAPEQAEGQRSSLASDWYSVGVMLFEALTGRLPFEGNPLRVLKAKQEQPAPDVRALLDGETEAEDLCELCEALLEREAQARPSGETLVARLCENGPWQPAVESNHPRELPPLVGRRAELAVLRESFEEVRSGSAVTLFIAGRSGVGKSALMGTFLAELGGDVVVLRGRCHEQESVPYKVFDPAMDALGGYLRRLPAGEARKLVPRRAASLLRVFPALGRIEPLAEAARGESTPGDARELRNQAFAALKELLFRLTDRTAVVLAVDDLQWGDIDSARMMEHLLGPPEPPPLLLLGAYRSDEVEGSEFLMTTLGERPRVSGRPRLLELEPLPQDSAEELARALLREAVPEHAAVAARLAGEAEGVPFFIVELVQHLKANVARVEQAEALPLTLQGVLLERVAALPPAAQALLRVLSVAAGPLEQAVALAAAELDAGDRSASAALRAARLSRTRGASTGGAVVETYHDRVREAMVSSLHPENTRMIHARIARAMERFDVTDPERLVVHHAGAGDRTRAGEMALEAARRAAEKLAFNRAAELYRKALELLSPDAPQRRALYEALGDALANAGRGTQAAEAYLQASQGMEELSDGRRLQRLAAQQYMRSGRIEEGKELAQVLLRHVGLEYPEDSVGAVTRFVWHRGMLALRGLDIVERDSVEVPSELLERIDTLGAIYQELSISDPLRGAVLHAQFLRGALSAGEPVRALQGLAWEVFHRSVLGGRRNERRATRAVEALEMLGTRIGTPYAQATCQMAYAVRALFTADYHTAIAAAREAERLFQSDRSPASSERGWVAFFRYMALEFAGDMREMLDETPQRARDAAERDDLFTMRLLIMAMVKAYLAADDPATAMAFLDTQRSRLGPGFTTFHHLVFHRTADTLLYQGRGREAFDYTMRLWSQIERSHAYRGPFTRSTVHYLRARCALAAQGRGGDERCMQAMIERDLELVAREGYLSGMPECLHGALLHSGGQTGTARTAVERGLALLQRDRLERYALCAQRRLGEIMRGEAGAALVAAADSGLFRHGVRNPARWAALHVGALHRL
jgi:eukaryotic-like serine/threonine-protein kinase